MTCEGLYCDTVVGAPVAVTAGVETTGIDFALALEGVISGAVSPSGKQAGFSGVSVRAWASGGEDAGVWDMTDSSGAYELSCLGAGSYFINVYADEKYCDYTLDAW